MTVKNLICTHNTIINIRNDLEATRFNAMTRRLQGIDKWQAHNNAEKRRIKIKQ
jgi:hypothetical protein